MNDMQSLRKQATAFRKGNDFEKALSLYQSLWDSTHDKWDGWGAALCLNKLKKFEKALVISKAVFEIDREFEYIRGQYSWAAYMSKIKNYGNDEDYNQLKLYANGIVQLTKNNINDTFRQLTILKLMDICEKKGFWDALIIWSQKINADDLSSNPFKTNINGKNISIPSNRQKFYLKTTKAYEKLEKWGKCYEESCKALKHFPDDIWYSRRKAISEGNTGNIEKAIESLIEISLVKGDWFIHRDIAVLYAKNNQFSKALDSIIESCLISYKQPDPGFRWEIYFNAAQYLKHLGEIECSKKHLSLAYSLKSSEGWKIGPALSELANELGYALDEIDDIKGLFYELKSFWEEHKFSQLPNKEGEIKTILPNGKSGFISTKEGDSFYFRTPSFKGNRRLIEVSQKVKFYTKESFDRKKNKKSLEAVEIKVI
jgi:tetratricopeptide (TPR) repeat protein